MLLNILKNYMRNFPLNEGKRVVYNHICKNISADNEVIMTHDGVKIELDPGDHNQRYIYWYGRYNEKDEIKIIKALLHEGDCFIDVGANVGYFALVAARRVGNTGHVIALEPNPYTFNLLERNVSLNGFARVELIQAAAGERNGKAVLHFSEHGADVTASISTNEVCDRHDSFVDVKVATIDSIVNERRLKPAVIKIDAEEYDEMVIQGAKETLSSEDPPILMVETLESTSEMSRFLSSLGFERYILSKHMWRKCAFDDAASSSINALLINKDVFPKYEDRLKPFLQS